MNLRWRLKGAIQCLSVRPSSVNLTHFWLLFQNHWRDFNETLLEASSKGPLSSFFIFTADLYRKLHIVELMLQWIKNWKWPFKIKLFDESKFWNCVKFAVTSLASAIHQILPMKRFSFCLPTHDGGLEKF